MSGQEEVRITAQAIIRLLDGNMTDYKRLISKLKGTCKCNKVECTYYIDKKNKVTGTLCTSCGEIVDKRGKVVRKSN